MSTIPIILFDGPDNVGKGTQIKLLRKWMSQTPFTITDLDSPVGKNLEEKEQYGINATRNQLVTIQAGWKAGVPQIADRCHYTEYAYSILRKKHELSTIIELEQGLMDAQNDILGIIFVDSIDGIVARDDGKSKYDPEDTQAIKEIIDRFHEIARASNFECHVISIHEKSIEEVHDEVKKIIQKRFSWI